MIPYGLPYPGPVKRVDSIVALHSSLLSPRTTSTSLISTSSPRGDLWCRAEGSLRLALRAVPRPWGDFFQPNTVQMRRRITAITQEKHIFIVCFATDSTRLEVSQVVLCIFNHHRRVDFGDLYSILDGI